MIGAAVLVRRCELLLTVYAVEQRHAGVRPAAWPMARSFAELRRELDPRVVFDNACLRRAFPS